MEKKRSKGVTFFGWFFIISSIIGLLSLINPKLYDKLQGNLFNNVEFFYLTSAPFFGILAGIYILRLKNWARKLIIVLYFLSLIYSTFPLVYAISPQGEFFGEFIKSDTGFQVYVKQQKDEIRKRVKPEYQEEQIKKIDQMNNIMIKALPIFVYVMLGLAMAWNIFVIYFFTRPKVKEMFR